MYKQCISAILLPGLFVLSCNLFAQSPGGIRKQSLWLKGNFSSDAGRQSAMNFNPAMSVNDGKTLTRIPAHIESLRSVTIFTVYQNPGADDEKKVWEITGDFGDLLLSTRQVMSKSRKTNIVFAKDKPGFHKPGGSETIIHTYLGCRDGWITNENAEYKESSIQFGNSNSAGVINNARGLISEFILYEKILNEEEISKVETYLALKYGITLEKNYLGALGETVWDWKNDQTYSNNIAGIGRDDQSSLYQKQATSCSTDEQLVIGVNKIVQSNSENTGEINDRDYLIWGDNAQPFRLNEQAETCANEILLPGKNWLMKPSGNTASMISTELKIDTKAMLPQYFPKEGFCLVIDRSASGNFVPGQCSYILPDSISPDGIAVFRHIFWDTDGSGRDAFTFGFRSTMLPANAALKNKNAASLISFRVYPNPVTDGHYKISVTLDKPADIKIQVYDINQQLVDSKKGTGQSAYLFSEYINASKGAYTVKLVTPDTELSRIIILQ